MWTVRIGFELNVIHATRKRQNTGRNDPGATPGCVFTDGSAQKQYEDHGDQVRGAEGLCSREHVKRMGTGKDERDNDREQTEWSQGKAEPEIRAEFRAN